MPGERDDPDRQNFDRQAVERSRFLQPSASSGEAVRTSSRTAVRQSFGSFVAISLPQPLRLPIGADQHQQIPPRN